MNKRLLQAAFCVLLVAPGFAQSQYPNVPIGYGTEPSIITNRIDGKVTISWMGFGAEQGDIWTRPSFNSGTSWLATAYLAGSNGLPSADPTMTVATSQSAELTFILGGSTLLIVLRVVLIFKRRKALTVRTLAILFRPS